MAKQIRFTTPDIQTINQASIPQRSLIAQRLFEQGSRGAPVGHLTQGLNRLAQGLIGGQELGSIRQDERALAEQDRAAKAAAAENMMKAFAQRTEPGPEFQGPTQPIPQDLQSFSHADKQAFLGQSGTQFQLPESPPVQRPPSPQEIAQVLLGNPDNQGLGAQLMLAEAQKKPPAPVALGEGQKLVNPLTGLPVAFNPKPAPQQKPQAPPAIVQLQKAFKAATDPAEKAQIGDLIKKMTTIKEPISVSQTVNSGDNLPFKIPQGFMLLDESDPSKGVTPIPGGPKDTVTGENAGKTQMIRTAQKAAKGIESFIFGKDGKLDRGNILNAQLNTPGTKGRELRNRMEFGIQAITRLETGAAMPDSELQNTMDRFMPQVGDTKEIVNLKIKMFNDFLGGTLKLVDPSGRFNEQRFQSELETRRSNEPGGQKSLEEIFGR